MNALYSPSAIILFGILLTCVASTSARAQGSIEVIDSISLRSEHPDDNISRLPALKFGFGSDWSDGPDTANGKGEFPFPFIGGPDGFAASLYVRDFQGDPAFDYKDVRGLPDSVGSGEVNFFTLRYIIRIQRQIGRAIITTSGDLTRGIDSIVIRSTHPGANFSHTFYQPGGSVTVSRVEITELEMLVYYNYNRAASVPVAGYTALNQVVAYPSPTQAGSDVMIRADAPRGSVAIVADLLGREVMRSEILDSKTIRLNIPANLAAGIYPIRIVAPTGRVIGSGRIVVN